MATLSSFIARAPVTVARYSMANGLRVVCSYFRLGYGSFVMGLEGEFCCQLDEARGSGADDRSEIWIFFLPIH